MYKPVSQDCDTNKSGHLNIHLEVHSNEDRTAQSPAFEVFHQNKFQPAKEAAITHIKWTLNWRIGFICCILALTWWAICLIDAAKDHKKIGFCDVTAPLFYSCNGLNERHAANLCKMYCSDEPCWEKLDDSDIDIHYITDDDVVIGSTVNGSCAHYNNESMAMFYCRIFFLIIILLWCWKLFKQIWKGIELPSLENADVTGFKKLLKIPDKIGDKLYDLRINLRVLVDKLITMENKNHEQNFIKVLLDGFLLLFTMQFFMLDLWIQIFNLFTGGFEMSLELMVYLLFIRTWLKRRQNAKDKVYERFNNHYPERNIPLACVYDQMCGCWLLKTITPAFISLLISYWVLPVSQYDSWMRAITIFKSSYRLLGGCAKACRLYIIVSLGYCYKQSVSVRESLLIQDTLKTFFVWAIFKIEIRDDDSFIFVDEKRSSEKTIVLYNWRKGKGRMIVFPWTVLLTAAIFWGFACYVTLGNGSYDLSVFQDVRF